MDSMCKLVHRWLRLLEIEFDVFHCTDTQHQAADELLTKTTIGPDQMETDDDIPVVFITASSTTEMRRPVLAMSMMMT